MSAWVQAMRTDGALSCYQGFGVAVLSMAAYKALYFGLFDTAKAVLLPQASFFVAMLQFGGCLGRECPPPSWVWLHVACWQSVC